MKFLFSTTLIICLLTSCGVYRNPTDDDELTMPTTNNPGVTRDSGNWTPGQSF